MPTLAFGSYLVPGGDTCGDSRLVRPAPTGDVYAPPIALDARILHVVDAVQRLEPLGPNAICAWPTTGTTTSTVRSSCGGSRPGEAPRLYTEADGWQPLQIWGMGIASQDLTGDGDPEVFITSQGDNKLQTLADGAAQPTYKDIALERGVTAQRPFVGGDVLPSTAWHPEFEDVNNDGLVDLFVTKGNVEAQPDYATRDPSNLLLGQADGTFVGRGASRPESSASNGPAGRHSSISTSTACSISSS